MAFAAFYADCVHEVLPITSGYRLALVYNLRRQGRGQLPGTAELRHRADPCGDAVTAVERCERRS